MIEDALHPQVTALKQKILQTIEALPDNPRITRLGSGAFTMSVSDTFAKLKTGTKDKRELISNWCPEFHDFKRQYQKIATILNGTHLERVEEVLQGILDSEKYYQGSGNNRTYSFHPDVIANVRKAWEA